MVTARPYLQWSVSALVLFTAIEVLYVLGPSLPVSERLTIPGAAAARVISLVLAWGLGFYFHYLGTLKFARFFWILGGSRCIHDFGSIAALPAVLLVAVNSRLKTVKD